MAKIEKGIIGSITLIIGIAIYIMTARTIAAQNQSGWSAFEISFWNEVVPISVAIAVTSLIVGVSWFMIKYIK